MNNNGNVTFTGPLPTLTPFGIHTSSIPIIAPFFADVDTNNAASDVVRYGSASLGGRNVFGVNWINVGYFQAAADKLNSFQLILTERVDTGVGNFDIQFNYDQIKRETGSASGGTNGFGGNSAAAGYSTGTNGVYYEFGASRMNGRFLDSNLATSLIYGSLNSGGVAGQYNFQVRNGVIINPSVPEPANLAMLGLVLAGIGAARRKRSA